MITVNGVDKFNNTLDLYGLSTDDCTSHITMYRFYPLYHV